MKQQLKVSIELLIIVALLVGASLWWYQRSDTRVDSAHAYDAYTNQVVSDIDFFTEKVAAGNWIFGEQLAALNERAFRLTNDFSYLQAADEAAADYLDREHTAGAYATLSNLALTKHEFVQARDYAESARTLANTTDENIAALGALFDAHSALGEIHPMQEVVVAMKAIDPDSFATLVREARLVARTTGDTTRAVQLFAQACRHIDQSNDIWNRAWCATHVSALELQTDKPLAAIDRDLERVLEQVYPNFPLALALRGHIAAHQADYEQSVSLYERAIEQSQNPDLLVELAYVERLRGNSNTAQEILQQYLDAIGDHHDLTRASSSAIVHVRGLIQAYASLDQTDDALHEATHDITDRPDDPGAYQSLAFLYLDLGEYAAALEASLNIPGTVTLTPEEALVRGIALQQLDREADAQMWLERACEHQNAWSLRAILLTQQTGVTCA